MSCVATRELLVRHDGWPRVVWLLDARPHLQQQWNIFSDVCERSTMAVDRLAARLGPPAHLRLHCHADPTFATGRQQIASALKTWGLSCGPAIARQMRQTTHMEERVRHVASDQRRGPAVRAGRTLVQDHVARLHGNLRQASSDLDSASSAAGAMGLMQQRTIRCTMGRMRRKAVRQRHKL